MRGGGGSGDGIATAISAGCDGATVSGTDITVEPGTVERMSCRMFSF